MSWPGGAGSQLQGCAVRPQGPVQPWMGAQPNDTRRWAALQRLRSDPRPATRLGPCWVVASPPCLRLPRGSGAWTCPDPVLSCMSALPDEVSITVESPTPPMNVSIESAVIMWEPGWPEGLPDGRDSAAWLLGCPQDLTGLGGTLGLYWSTSSCWRRTPASLGSHFVSFSPDGWFLLTLCRCPWLGLGGAPP